MARMRWTMSVVARRKVIVMLRGSWSTVKSRGAALARRHVSQIFSTACMVLYHKTDQNLYGIEV